MVVPTVRSRARVFIDTLTRLIKIWVVLQLLPAMALLAVHILGASPLLVVRNLAANVPFLADFRLVRVLPRVSSKVLNIVSVLTARLIVLVVEGAVDCLVFMNKKFGILLKLVQLLNFKLFNLMGEAAVVPITAVFDLLRIVGTQFCLVFLGMIKLLHCIMGIEALESLGALTS